MGTISQLHDHSRPPAHRIGEEGEALAVATALAAQFRIKAEERDRDRIFPVEQLEALSASGLFGVTAPAEANGIDIANGVLAEIVASLAEADASIAEVCCMHLRVIDLLRWHGGGEQQAVFFERALAGDVFALAAPPSASVSVSLAAEGHGLRAEGRENAAAGVLFADWIGFAARNADGHRRFALLPRRTEGLQIIDDRDSLGLRTAGGGTVLLQNAAIGEESVFSLATAEDHAAVTLFAELMHAAVDLGIARAAFADIALACEEKTKGETPNLFRLGRLAAQLEAVTAMIERAARMLDIAQVNADTAALAGARGSILACHAAAAGLVSDITAAAFDFCDPARQVRADLHCRNARAHATRSADSLYRAAGLALIGGKNGDPAIT